MSAKVRVIRDGLAAHIKKLRSISGAKGFSVGVHGDAGEHGHFTMAELAAVHEFGLGVPARPFLGPFASQHEATVKARISDGMRKAAKGATTPAQVIARIGEWAVGQIKLAISAGIPPPNEDSTIAKKGSSKPLIDTGRLRNSIAWKPLL